MEALADFMARLSKDVGCYYHLLQTGYYPLKRNNTMQKGKMGVFAFVKELGGRFRIHTFEDASIRAEVNNLFDGSKDGLFFGERGSFMYVEKGSNGDDYQRAVIAFKAIRSINN
jgi:hypothetical protein